MTDTKLDRALHWWRNNDGPIPKTHLAALDRAECIVVNDDEDCMDLNENGHAEMQRRGFRPVPGGFWKPDALSDTGGAKNAK